MLDESQVVELARSLWSLHVGEYDRMETIRGYVAGERGAVSPPETASQDIKSLARMSVHNVLAPVRDAFCNNLSVTGLRSPDAQTGLVWELWQAHSLDGRQTEAHSYALTYGAGYVAVAPFEAGGDVQVRVRSPRYMCAAYSDPADRWPSYALEVWTDDSDPRVRVQRGLLYDAEAVYPIRLGDQPAVGTLPLSQLSLSIRMVDAPVPHGAGVCPVVRFQNGASEDGSPGEIEPLIGDQKALNEVNFDRLVVSRFGAFPQKWVTGWAPESRDEGLRASQADVWAFDNPDVRVGAVVAATVDAYHSVMNEMLSHIAMRAQVPLNTLDGKLTNLSAEALAMAEAPYQRKLAKKRELFGEAWEQVLWLLARYAGVQLDPSAEIEWHDAETRSFAMVVDGISKLAAIDGFPVEELLFLVPGMTRQRQESIRKKLAAAPLPPADSTPPVGGETAA